MANQETNLDRLLKARAEIDEALRRYKSAVTIFFSDVVGSTAYFSRYGDTAGMAMLQRHAELATNAVSEFQGTVVKTIGDSVMAEFPEPLLGVRAAVEIQRRLFRLNPTLAEHERVQLRIGLHTGSAFRRESDIFGDAVNLAARITKRTGPAQILISRVTAEAIASDPELRANLLGKIAIEGRSEKEDVFEVVWTDSAAYADLRQNVTAAFARGELVSPGVSLQDFLSPAESPAAAAEPAPATPAAETLRSPVTTQSLDMAQGQIPPELLDRYELLGEAGRGAIGIVYKARDRETGEIVALKVLKPEIASDSAIFERFVNELRLARKITHRNVCRIYDFTRVNATACISMEFVDGESLRQILQRFGSLSYRKGLQIAQQICAGLREAHAQGIVHRDLKPENVMLDHAGNVKLMDFGIARSADTKATGLGAVIGTPAYMAPEQAAGKPVDHRADIYSLGLILYEIFTGAPAFTGDTPVALAVKQIRETPSRPRQVEPTLSLYVEQIILKCLEKDVARRFQSGEELEAALAAALAGRGYPRLSQPARKAVATAVLVASVLGAFLVGRKARPVQPAPQVNGSAAVASQANGSGSNPSSAPAAATLEPVARNAKELNQLKQQGHMAYYEFQLGKSDEFTRVGPVSVRLNKTDTKRQTYTLTVQMKENRVELKDRALFEPLRLYDDRSRHMLELVVYKIESSRASGYLTVPKPSKTEAHGAQNGAQPPKPPS